MTGLYPGKRRTVKGCHPGKAVDNDEWRVAGCWFAVPLVSRPSSVCSHTAAMRDRSTPNFATAVCYYAACLPDVPFIRLYACADHVRLRVSFPTGQLGALADLRVRPAFMGRVHISVRPCRAGMQTTSIRMSLGRTENVRTDHVRLCVEFPTRQAGTFVPRCRHFLRKLLHQLVDVTLRLRPGGRTVGSHGRAH